MYHVRSTNGNTRLGATKFVEELMNFCINKLTEMGISTEFTREQYSQIRVLCEEAKKDLTKRNVVDICIGEEKIPVTIDEYNNMIEPYIKATMECVKMALKVADLDEDEINKVVLIGGGTFTPLVRTTLREFFGMEVNTEVNPMEAGIIIIKV